MQKFGVLLVAVVGFFLLPVLASAATLTVTNTNNSGDGSLRQAVLDASSGDTISFSLTLPATITVTSKLIVDKDLTIAGPGISNLTLSGNHAAPVFDIGMGYTVGISGLTVGNGKGNGGAGFLNRGNLTLTYVAVTNNMGGGIGCSSTGKVTLNQVTVSNNTTTFPGLGSSGAGISGCNDMTLTNVTVNGNTASAAEAIGGGGIFQGSSTATATLTNVTISGNTVTTTSNDPLVSAYGGGLYSNGTIHLNNVTFTGNQANAPNGGTAFGGGLYQSKGIIHFTNTIIAGNSATNAGPDCSTSQGTGTMNSQGYNLVQDTGDCTIGGDLTGNVTGQNPNLAVLMNNGGATQTHALTAPSPAIDAGNPAGCTDPNGNPLNADQRGKSRYGTCDIGSFEFGFCGDGFLQTVAGEGCDDGNLNNGDGCSASCVTEQPVPPTPTPTPTPTPDPEPATTPVQDPTDDPSGEIGDPAVEPVSEQPEQGPASEGTAGGGCSLATAPHAGHTGTVIGFLLLTIPLILGGKRSNFFEV